MGPTDVLAELARRGVEIAVNGDRLRFRPRDAVTPDLHEALIEHKAALVRLVADGGAEVLWRAAIMREQARGRTSLPFLVVRRDFRDIPGLCMSCDGPLNPGRRIRCTPCAEAAKLVADEFLEGIRRARRPESEHHVGG